MVKLKLFHVLAFFFLVYLIGFVKYADNYKNIETPSPAALKQPVRTDLPEPVRLDSCCNGKYCWKFEALYGYDVSALVFGTSHKFAGDFSDTMTDVGLLWGENASQGYYKNVKLRVMMDHYTVRWRDGGSFNLYDAANTHVVTCDAAAFKKIRALGTGDQVRLKGWLINAAISENPGEKDPSKIMTWKSSVTTKDTGEGSCELLYVKSAADVEILSKGSRFWLYLKWLGISGLILGLVGKLAFFHFCSKKEMAEAGE